MSAGKYPSIFSRQMEAIVYVFFIFYGYITNSQNDQLPVGSIAQLVEHWVRVPFRPELLKLSV